MTVPTDTGSAAFLPSDPKLLAEKTTELLLDPSKSLTDDSEHLFGRIQSLLIEWISSGLLENVVEWSEGVRNAGENAERVIAARYGLSLAERVALRTVAISAMAHRFSHGDSVARLLVVLRSPKRANWRRAVLLMAKADRAWTKADFEKQIKLVRSAAHTATQSLIEHGVLIEYDAGHGKKSFELSPLGWQVAKRLEKEYKSEQAHDPETLVEIAVAPSGNESLTPYARTFNLPQDAIQLLFNSGATGAVQHRDLMINEFSPTSGLWTTDAVEHDDVLSARKPDYPGFFHDALFSWMRSQSKISDALVEYSRTQVRQFASTNPVGILTSYFPPLIAAHSAKTFIRIAGLMQRRSRPKDQRDIILILFTALAEESRINRKWKEDWNDFLVSSVIRSLSIQILPRIASIHFRNKRINGSIFKTLHQTWTLLYRADYPKNVDVKVNMCPALEAPEWTTNPRADQPGATSDVRLGTVRIVSASDNVGAINARRILEHA